MAEELQMTDTEIFAYYADKYETKKTNTLLNLLGCGKILHNCKLDLFVRKLKDKN